MNNVYIIDKKLVGKNTFENFLLLDYALNKDNKNEMERIKQEYKIIPKTELKAINSNQKSFYKRAYTHTDGNATILTSYTTQVCKIVDNEFIRLWGGWSSTTAKHINEFRQQNGLPKISKSEWQSMEVAEQ